LVPTIRQGLSGPADRIAVKTETSNPPWASGRGQMLRLRNGLTSVKAARPYLGGWCSTGVLQAVVIGSKPVSGSHGWL